LGLMRKTYIFKVQKLSWRTFSPGFIPDQIFCYGGIEF